jgi:hypothetical protein
MTTLARAATTAVTVVPATQRRRRAWSGTWFMGTPELKRNLKSECSKTSGDAAAEPGIARLRVHVIGKVLS